MILSKIRDKMVISVVSFCKFIISKKRKFLEQSAISGKASYARFFYSKWAGWLIKFKALKILMWSILY